MNVFKKMRIVFSMALATYGAASAQTTNKAADKTPVKKENFKRGGFDGEYVKKTPSVKKDDGIERETFTVGPSIVDNQKKNAPSGMKVMYDPVTGQIIKVIVNGINKTGDKDFYAEFKFDESGWNKNLQYNVSLDDEKHTTTVKLSDDLKTSAMFMDPFKGNHFLAPLLVLNSDSTSIEIVDPSGAQLKDDKKSKKASEALNKLYFLFMDNKEGKLAIGVLNAELTTIDPETKKMTINNLNPAQRGYNN